MLSVLCLAFIVWQTLSGAQALLVAQQFVQILYVILAAIAQHLVYLAFNVAVLAAVFKMPVEEGVAVAIMGSQKSAPVAVTAITYVTKDAGIQGLLSVPCIVGQLAQIFLGAAYAPWVARRVKRVQAARKEAEAAGDGGAAAAAAEADGADGAEGKAVELANLDLEAPPITAAAAASTPQPQ
jgi:sodium/bile acid cotransporter 7